MPELTLDTETLQGLVDTTDTEFVGELITTFLADTPPLIAQLRQALTAGDAGTFRRAAHSLKSNGASLGAMEFSSQARALEMLGKAGTITDAAAGVDQLAVEYERARVALEAWQHAA